MPDAMPSTLRAVVLGPFLSRRLRGTLLGLTATLLALVLTQVGGPFVWVAAGLMARSAARGGPGIGVPAITLLAYLLATAALVPVAAAWLGRVPLPCVGADAGLRPYSLLYCVLNRHYVTTRFRSVLARVEVRLATALPGRSVYYLDAGFPFGGGFPMLPHLSHADGRRLDLAFVYTAADGTPRRGNGSPIGYFAFIDAPPGTAAACPQRLFTLRWDLRWMQGLLDKPTLDVAATRTLVSVLARQPGIGKILIEPHVRATLRLEHPRIRFQGCRAARHDDHLHVQLAARLRP